ncbi:MAG: iron-sulfur cluster insertion protein ErpA [Thermoprotei archaeon]
MTITTEDSLVTLTDAAAKQVEKLLAQYNKPDHGLRIFVRGGGCSGLSYGMSIEKEPLEDDSVVATKGVKVFIDPFTTQYIKGSVVDYVETIQSAGFKIDNPNAVRSCGCGQSFQTKDGAGSPHACHM